jgi:hypothetical protein
MAMVLLANSITLTPGTITIEVNKHEFSIHAVTREAAEGVLMGGMIERVKRIEGVTMFDAAATVITLARSAGAVSGHQGAAGI